MKEAIYEACEKRNDPQPEQRRVLMAGVPFDLYVADLRYHVDCRASFMCPRSVQAPARQSLITGQSVDSAINSLVEYRANNSCSVHNPVNLHNRYVEEGGEALSR